MKSQSTAGTCEKDLGLRFREVQHTQQVNGTKTALTPPRGEGGRREGMKEMSEKEAEVKTGKK